MSNLINLYIKNLLNNTSNQILKQYEMNPECVDIVFEGGVFNGSYESGFMYYLKTMETLKYIKVDKLSGCSIGAIQALSYFVNINDYDKLNKHLYNITQKQLKKHQNINIFDKLFIMLKTILPDDILDKVNNRLYISYFNIKSQRHVVKSRYKNIDELFEIIHRSCFVPLFVDNNLFYNKKYIDGMYPYIFKKIKNKKIVYLNITNTSYIFNMCSIKNEPTNIRRILDGIYDSHLFFTTNCSTNMCSYVDEHSYIINIKYFCVKILFSITLYVLHLIYILNNIIEKHSKYETMSFVKIIKILYIFCLKSFCI
jgi:hypothetical protein